MKIVECQQRTDDWYDIRCGIPSASNFDKIITIDGKPSKQREKYLYQLAGEILLGRQEETYQNGAMQRGIEMEAEARQLYELITGQEVKQVGFCIEKNYGASPDGVIGEEGLLEIKCPILSTHISYLLKNELPSEYYQQTQGQLLVTGYKWVDFLSYYPAIKSFLIRVTPDPKFQEALKTELNKFCKELNEITNKLKEEK